MIWYPVKEPFVAFTTSKEELPLSLQRAFNENEEPLIKQQLWENIYEVIASHIGLKIQQLVFARQIHSSHLAVINKIPDLLPVPNTDALITNAKDCCLCIQTADCTPILIIDPVNLAVGAIHSGWKGAAQDIPGKAVFEMEKNYGSRAADLLIYMGPCISQKHYEVGTDVFKTFEKMGLATRDVFIPGAFAGKYFFNLHQANVQLLLNKGIQTQHIFTENLCTFSDATRFYSARRDGSKTGRIITGILIRR